MKLILILGFLLATTAALADEAKPVHKKIIDVGNLEIKGEIRRPFIQYLDTDRATTAALPAVADRALKDYEASLLKPALPRAKGKSNASH